MVSLLIQGPQVVHVGRVSAVYWPGHENAATVLAEYADGATRWPGLPPAAAYPIRLILAPDAKTLDSLTEGRVPRWRSGVAFPDRNTVIVIAGRTARPVLRHELAHLALRQAVRRVPLWFDEGYASRAAEEWGRLDALQVNWALVRGRAPSLRVLDRELRAGATRAEAAYALATTAILMLERLGGERGLEPLMTNLTRNSDLDAALRSTHFITLDQFETMWQRDLKKRYGWLLAFTSMTLFWAFVSLLVLGVWVRRRRRDRERIAALDEGWVVDVDDPPAS